MADNDAVEQHVHDFKLFPRSATAKPRFASKGRRPLYACRTCEFFTFTPTAAVRRATRPTTAEDVAKWGMSPDG